jgi:hypothetical protein
MRVAPFFTVLLSLAACSNPDEGPLMDPGKDCLGCHGGGGEANRWTAAGTWTRGAEVTVVDANGKSVTMRGNKVGNFYTAESLAFPLTAYVDGVVMPKPVVYGGCNMCHEGARVSTGPLMRPGQDCLACHQGGLAPRYTVAGTWPAAGASVELRDAQNRLVTLTTNEVGNFYTAEALAFPLTATVDGSLMEDPVPHGDCNRCHHGRKDAEDD